MVELWEQLESIIVPLTSVDTLPDSTEEWQEMVVRFCDAFDGMGYCERMVTFSNIFKYANTLCVYSKR